MTTFIDPIMLIPRSRVYNVRKNNTLRMDPSRTAMIRKRFVQEMAARFNKLEQLITRAVEKEDLFGLQEKQVATVGRVFAAHARYTALTTAEQLAEFRKWSDSQLNGVILGGADAGNRNWLERYIKESYEKGQGRAFDDAMKKYSEKYSEKFNSKMDYYRGKRDEFLRSSFRQPASIERVNLLASRSFMDLKGVTQDMSTKMNRIMTDSIIQGRGPRETGRELNKVTGIGRNRGITIARTETIRAHADGQLEALKNMGVEEVGVMVEWSSASDDLVCGLCADMDGSVMPIDKAGSIIPLHPNCRCCWLPANIGEDKSRKVWTEKDKEGKAVWRDLEQKSGKVVEGKLDKLGFDKVIGERLPNAFADRVVVPHVVAEPMDVPEVEAPKVVEIMPEVKAPVGVGTQPELVFKPPVPIAETKSLELKLVQVKDEVVEKKATLDKINAEIAEKQAQLAQVKLDIASAKKEAFAAWDDKLPADKGMESVKKAFNADMQSISTKEQVDHVGWTLTSIEDKLGDNFKVWRDAWKEGMPANDHARFQFMEMRAGRNGQYLTGTGRIEVQARYAELTSRSTEVPKFGNEMYTIDNSVSGTIRHEYGHFIHDKFVGTQEVEWESLYSSWRTTQVISKYGKTDSAEYFAEAFSALTHPNYSKAATKIPWEVEQWFVKRGIVK